ncbi:MAG: hypothetical protein AAB426_08015 [Myxococcota bacterium]
MPEDNSNRYCEALKIDVPCLERVVGQHDASTYSLLIVAIVEHGSPMTLAEAAKRFEAAGVGPADEALAALKKCRPGRPPLYRDGDYYALDPHDDELDLWLFRLGLRPPKVPRLQVVRATPEPLPGLDQPLTIAELQEAWRGKWLSNFSAQRLALAILDAHHAPMKPEEVVSFVSSLTDHHALRVESGEYWRMGAVRVRDDGTWEADLKSEALLSARKAVRDRIAMDRKWAGMRYDPVVAEANQRAGEAKRAANAAELAKLRRVIVVCFPAKSPRAVTLVDVAARELATFVDGELDEARKRLDQYDVICGIGVRELLRQLGVDPEERRLAELGPPQKSITLNQRGRSLKITTAMLIQGSCGIGKPFGDPAKMAGYLEKGQIGRLRDRLEADAKSLYALYNYGRVHGCVRLRWGFLDEIFPAPWLHRDEEFLYGVIRRAFDANTPMEVVVGNAPGWADPWARAQVCCAVPDGTPYGGLALIDKTGSVIDERDIQLARIGGKW